VHRVIEDIGKNSVVGFPSRDDPKGEKAPLNVEGSDPYFRVCKVKDRYAVPSLFTDTTLLTDDGPPFLCTFIHHALVRGLRFVTRQVYGY
jgi:hypothetical protein